MTAVELLFGLSISLLLCAFVLHVIEKDRDASRFIDELHDVAEWEEEVTT